MESYEKVFGNVDILALIFEYLDFKGQLRLAQVNEQLRNAYEVLSAKVNFSSWYLHRWIPSTGKFQSKTVIADEMGVNGYCLHDEVFRDFLVVYAERVRHLTLIIKAPINESGFNAFLKAFCNLRSLTANDMYFSKANFKNCPADLQELKLINPRIKANALVDFIGENMKNLHKLKIEYRGEFCGIEHQNFIKMCRLPKLEFLQFNSCFFDGQIEEDLELPAASNLKHLDIGLWEMELLKWLPVHLLSNLKVLHLRLNKRADNLFSILTDTCTYLENLSLNFIEFGKTKTITLPPKVTELRFYRCSGLRHTSLKKILTEFQIIKFCSRRTSYKGEFDDFKISTHIRSLEFDFVNILEFRSAYENNTQLKELIYNAKDVIYFGPIGVQDVSFNSTLNLERLDISFIPTYGAITQLTSLRSLRLRPVHGHQQSWKITDLLKHPTLHELSIEDVFYHFHNLQAFAVDQPLAMSNITRLSITPNILKDLMNCWLKLFTANKQMTLVCWPILNERDLGCAYLLVNNENFPRELKFMDICCLTIDCAFLRRKSEEAIREYFSGIRLPQHILLSFEELTRNNSNMARRYRIILSWKYEYNL